MTEEMIVHFESSIPADLFARICLTIEEYAPGALVEMLSTTLGPRVKFHLPLPADETEQSQ